MSIADQRAVVDAPLVDMSVLAGAGSGKTSAAIGRVLSILSQLPETKRLALLSFSNVAIDTFRNGLRGLVRDSSRVSVSTFDAFFTQKVVLPHSWRLMGCDVKPYLVLGDEPFLSNFTIVHDGRPQRIADLKISFSNNSYQAALGNSPVPWPLAMEAIVRLGRTGAFTYDSSRYWAHATLTLMPYLAQLLAYRYPYIMIDEAQDIGSMDWAIIQQLRLRGMGVCLVGDPAQAIFGFNGGDGQFLRTLPQTEGVAQYSLRTNFRSVPAIVHCANRLTGRQDAAFRLPIGSHSGAFIVPYDSNAPHLVVNRFTTIVHELPYSTAETAIICRANDMVSRVRGGTLNRGIGLVKRLAKATELRSAKQYDRAFAECLAVTAALLEPQIPRFVSLVSEDRSATARSIRARIWQFTCDHRAGLPSELLNARDIWLPQLVINVRALLQDLASHGLTFSEISRKLTTRDLDSTALGAPGSRWRVDTVHQVKGESIGAVLYVATERHAQALMSGIDTENGRIGYVALTRARDLFWMAVPIESYSRLLVQAASVGIMTLPEGI